MTKLTIEDLREQVTSRKRWQRAGQLMMAEKLAIEHPELVLIECADENTGVRFGQANKRRSHCKKIGSSAWPNRHTYQLWASWAPADLA